MTAEELLQRGDPAGALAALQARVRDEPANPALRVFLFQLLCVQGEWERARDQLRVVAELQPTALPLVHVYGPAIACEVLRREVFGGTRTPLVMGEPLPWVALLLHALSAEAQGRPAEAQSLRSQALEDGRAVPGKIDGHPFGWIADADSRLGPICEAIIEGRYYWIPFERIRQVSLQAPSDLRDVVWMPAQLRLENSGEVAALLPVRYPGSETDKDGSIQLARRTEWDEVQPQTFHGRGQRMLATDADEYPLLNVRTIELAGA
jgi:type VI secretion system protein ImpE